MFHAALKDAVKDAKPGIQARLARSVGVSPARINQILKAEGGSEPLKRKIARFFDCDYNEFLDRGRRILEARGEKVEPPSRAWTPEVICPVIMPLHEIEGQMDVQIEDYYAAPLVDGTIAAGPGMTIFEDEIRSLVWIYAPALHDRRKHKLIAVEISQKEGDSMMPTLMPGDIVLVDRDDPAGDEHLFRNGAIYAIRDGQGGCQVKRVYKDPKQYIIGSDNRGVAPSAAWTGNMQELIVGRVVWGWRNLLET